MYIDEYFAKLLSNQYQSHGTESDWLDLGEFEVKSGVLSIGDCAFFPGDQVELDVLPGLYKVQARVIDYGTDRRISQLRAFLNAANFTKESAGDFSVDFALVGVCDYGAVSSILDNLSEEALQDYYNYDYLDYGTLNLGEEPSGRMVYVRSGWGDGNYDVYKWVTDVGIVGVESVFIDPDEDYMFEDAEEYDILPSSDRSKIRDIQ